MDTIPKGWTIDMWVEHAQIVENWRGQYERERDCRYAEVRVGEEKAQVWRDRFEAERDRRYSEVKHAEERAQIIKAQADRDALELARQIQSYKDEKANELREQINSERGHYASKPDLSALVEKIDAQLKPINDFIASSQGRGQGMNASWQMVVASVGLIFTLMSIIGIGVGVVLYVAKPTITTMPVVPIK